MSLPTTFFIGRGGGTALANPFDLSTLSTSRSGGPQQWYRGGMVNPIDEDQLLVPDGQNNPARWYTYNMNATTGEILTKSTNDAFSVSYTTYNNNVSAQSGGHRDVIPLRDGNGLIGTTWSQNELRIYEFPNGFTYTGGYTVQQTRLFNINSLNGNNGSWGMATNYDSKRDRVYFGVQGLPRQIGYIDNFSTMTVTSDGSASPQKSSALSLADPAQECRAVEYDPLSDTLYTADISHSYVYQINPDDWSTVASYNMVNEMSGTQGIMIWKDFLYVWATSGGTTRWATRQT